MNRRGFLSFLGAAAAGVAAERVYSFPSIIVPRNVGLPGLESLVACSGTPQAYRQMGFNIAEVNAAIGEILIPIIEDGWKRDAALWVRYWEEARMID